MPHLDTQSGLASIVDSTSGKHSLFEEEIRKLPISVCSVFLDEEGKIQPAAFRETEKILTSKDHELILKVFPLTFRLNRNVVLEATPAQTPSKIAGKRVAVLFSGGPAPGGHNVLAGLKAALGRDNILFGIRRGPKGLLNGDVFEVDCRQLEDIVNTGGFDFLGTDRTKIKTPQQFEKVKDTVVKNRLDGLVIVGG